MMRTRLITLALFFLILMGVACEAIPEGYYVAVPSTPGSATPEYSINIPGYAWSADIATSEPMVSPPPTTEATPTNQATPTAEGSPVPTAIPPTLTPTNAPTPEERCWGIVSADRLNVRDAPSTASGAVIGQLEAGQIITMEAWSADRQWYRFYWLPGVNGYVYASYINQGEGADCSGLEVEAWQPPDNDAGLHLLYSARSDSVLPLVANGEVGNIKGTDGSEHIIQASREISPDLLISWRNLSRIIYGTRDCPPDWGQGDPRHAADQWWSAEYSTWQARNLLTVVDYFEYRNECVFVGDWEIAFDLRMLELATNAGVCLAVFSDGYGNPQVSEFVQRSPVLDYMQVNECQPGRLHIIAGHVYEGVNGGKWLFGRWQLFQDALDHKYDDLQWLFTEYGYAYGRGPVDCGAFWPDWDAAIVEYEQHPEVIGFQAFAVGAGPTWTDVSECW